MGQTNLKQRLDGLISNFESLPDNEQVTEALEHLRDAKEALEGYEEEDTRKQGQPA
jgi:hypothetical protein